jgi:WXG100 family type VII secretion target
MSIESSTIMVQDGLADAGAQLNARASEIVDELNTLIGQLAPLAETWTGPAASYYGPLQDEWNVAANGLFGPDGILGEIANAMNVTWNNYADAEWANVSTWQGAGGGVSTSAQS